LPKLRAREAARAVEMFLSRDALAPAALNFKSDRAGNLSPLRGLTMARREEPELDRDLADLPPDMRWREWMRRIEAVLFASATPVPRDDLARMVGQGASVDLLTADLMADLEGRPYELAKAGGGWMLRTRAVYAQAIRAAADAAGQALDLSEFDLSVLAAIAFHQPISRNGLKDIFGKDISRDLIGRLHARDLIATGPREPRPGARAAAPAVFGSMRMLPSQLHSSRRSGAVGGRGIGILPKSPFHNRRVVWHDARG